MNFLIILKSFRYLHHQCVGDRTNGATTGEKEINHLYPAGLYGGAVAPGIDQGKRRHPGKDGVAFHHHHLSAFIRLREKVGQIEVIVSE
ncbi:hypothetical protein D9M68_1001420 [compost metagenome]